MTAAIHAELAGVHVLVIEDDRDVLDLILRHLHDFGCVASTASSGEEGLRRALDDPPDVAIVDIMLPNMNGMEVARALRADERTRSCHIILASVLDAQDMESPHSDATLSKPFRRDALAAALISYARARAT